MDGLDETVTRPSTARKTINRFFGAGKTILKRKTARKSDGLANEWYRGARQGIWKSCFTALWSINEN